MSGVKKKRRQKKDDWMVMGPDPHFATCERCGGHEPPPSLPLSIPAFSAYCKYVTEKHADCVATATEPIEEAP